MRVLVVEDEIVIAMEIESILADAGHCCIGVAEDSQAARRLAGLADVAFVDLNLRDGPTGQELGIALSEEFGLTVIFMTADAQDLDADIHGPIGVLPKPVSEPELRQLLTYVSSTRAPGGAAIPPARMTLFHRAA